jgi:hypothetical protein
MVGVLPLVFYLIVQISASFRNTRHVCADNAPTRQRGHTSFKARAIAARRNSLGNGRRSVTALINHFRHNCEFISIFH